MIGIGPCSDSGGNLAIFRSRAEAVAFVAQDPFVLEGLLESYGVHEWLDQMLV